MLGVQKLDGRQVKDGKWTIYQIQHLIGINEWVYSSLDFFGYPPGFNASGKCWQETGIHGTLDDLEAREGLKWLRNKHPGFTFRCVKLTMTKKTLVTPW